MTEKQEKILAAALELFAREGFKVTSTSKIAKHAGVSEGLIFRHFTNKEGLLDAIIQSGEERAKLLFTDLVMEVDPKKMLKKYIELATDLANNQSESDFWKLQFKIKWETEQYGAHKIEPILQALTRAFEQLGNEQPLQEAMHLIICMDGMAAHYFLNKSFDLKAQVGLLMRKYEL